MCAPALKHMSKLIPDEAPRWLHEACGNSVWCRVSNGGIFDDYAWVLPFYDVINVKSFISIDGLRWHHAEPITDEETLRETEKMR